ncbi:MAG: DUF4982 domain-containing protein, partial [Bacteroidaceae bacterium]|nr:DUF4982 domain-containing protein [Bacteroidaceae bacterium]
LEEGRFYEGAGIYRHVWLVKEAPLHIAPFGIFAHSALKDNYTRATLTIETDVVNDSHADASATVLHELVDKNGTVIATARGETQGLIKPRTHAYLINGMEIDRPHLWTTDTPYLYTLRSMVVQNGKTLDTRTTRIGIREAKMDKDKGFLLNSKPLKMKGVNMHQDHAGVGAAIPDELQVYRLLQLKKFGCNAYRSSHNPMTPELLDACDSLGILVLEENRLTGINTEHTDLLRRMIIRDRNHPCIFAWSSGNEEWGLEWDARGEKVIRTMCEYAHQYDPTRPVAVATSSGPSVLLGADISGYNYVMQNPIDRYRRDYPTRLAIGSEETTGCGTRGCYFDDTDNGHMAALNRTPDTAEQPDNHLGSGCINRIERGWKFYDERPWLGGLFYWTGFDYRGEANPLKYPATGSEFGILDYCGFPKDEAYYLKAWWTDEPVLHLLPHWNLNEEPSLHSTPSPKVDVWAYSNCDEVELFVNGKSAGRKKMEKNGHLEWSVVYKPGTLKAVGYKNGKRQLTETIESASAPSALKINEERIGTLSILNIDVIDKKGRPVPTACIPIAISISGCAQILGVGNGDPAWRAKERPDSPDEKHFQMQTFNGKAQVILKVPNNEYAYEVNLKNRKNH